MALRTRRGCGICYRIPEGLHFVDLVYLDETQAMLLDNNDVEHYVTVSRDALIENWKKSGGWAVAVVYSPAAPLPLEVA